MNKTNISCWDIRRWTSLWATLLPLAVFLGTTHWTRGDLVDAAFANQRVAIYWQGGDRFVTAVNGGSANVTAASTWIDSWETWTIYQYPDGALAFRGPNGQYLRANGAGSLPLDVQGAAPGPWEKHWLVKRNGAIDDEFGLLCDANGKYVRAPGGTGSIIVNSSMSAYKPMGNFVAYSTTKGALVARALTMPASRSTVLPEGASVAACVRNVAGLYAPR